MPSFDYYVGNGAGSFLDNVGSGLGFFGSAGFSASVLVGSKQDKTYITDGAGAVQGPEAYNIKWTHPASGLIGQTGSGLPLTAIPNYQASINARFTHGSAVKTTNVKLRAYDRSNPNNVPSGCAVYAAELIHPSLSQTNNGSGSTTWTQIGGTGTLSLVSSPGTSGLSPNGINTSDTRHDHYLAISVNPTSIGSQSQLGFSIELEYL